MYGGGIFKLTAPASVAEIDAACKETRARSA